VVATSDPDPVHVAGAAQPLQQLAVASRRGRKLGVGYRAAHGINHRGVVRVSRVSTPPVTDPCVLVMLILAVLPFRPVWAARTGQARRTRQ